MKIAHLTNERSPSSSSIPSKSSTASPGNTSIEQALGWLHPPDLHHCSRSCGSILTLRERRQNKEENRRARGVRTYIEEVLAVSLDALCQRGVL